MVTVFHMTETSTRGRATIASMEASARRILLARGIDPDGLADQGDVATDLGVERRSVTHMRRVYSDGRRGGGRRGRAAEPYPERALEPFPAPDRVIGGGQYGGHPVWRERWKPFAWHLTREQTRAGLNATERALLDDVEE